VKVRNRLPSADRDAEGGSGAFANVPLDGDGLVAIAGTDRTDAPRINTPHVTADFRTMALLL
jgi:hypothetical protein